jgi:hypothetical protein
MWFVGLTIFCAVGIPFFFLFLLGLKLISSTVRSIGNGAKYTLVAIWALSIAGLIIYTLKQASEVAFDNKEVIKQPLNLNAGDTLKIKFRYDDFYAKDLYHHHNYLFTVDQNDAEVIYSNNVAIHVKYTDEPVGYIQIEKQAHGKSVNEARQRAKDISYGFTVEGNQIVLDNYFTIPKANKVRDQEVEIFVYLPKGVLFRPDSSLRYFDYSDNWFFNLHESGEYTYLVKPAEENDYEDVILSIDGIQIKDSVINVGDIRIETTAEKSTRIELGPDGTLIKQ